MPDPVLDSIKIIGRQDNIKHTDKFILMTGAWDECSKVKNAEET
jgi:hypothetical protein